MLRHIAVHVEEPAAGGFHWVLTEQSHGSAWLEIQRAGRAAGTYQRAMADGLLALQAMVEDLDAGPRRAAPGPARRKAARAPAVMDRQGTRMPPAEDAPPAKPSLFGFGPAR